MCVAEVGPISHSSVNAFIFCHVCSLLLSHCMVCIFPENKKCSTEIALDINLVVITQTIQQINILQTLMCFVYPSDNRMWHYWKRKLILTS